MSDLEQRLHKRIAGLEAQLKYANNCLAASNQSIENFMLNASYWEDCHARLAEAVHEFVDNPTDNAFDEYHGDPINEDALDALKDALKQATKYGYNNPNIGEHDV